MSSNTVNLSNQEKLEIASDWHNTQTKPALIKWATDNKLDIGQNLDQLHQDWNSKVIEAYAAIL